MSWSGCRRFPVEAPLPTPDCNATADAPWHSAGDLYAVHVETRGPSCGEASLLLTLTGPDGTVLYRLETGAAAIRTLYGVPGAREMQAELESLIDQRHPKPQRSGELPVWPRDDLRPDGFEPAIDRAAYEAARADDLALFCHAYAPRTQTCVLLVAPAQAAVIGRRLLE